MSSNCPPQLHLSIPPNTTSFKRSFEQFGFDLDSPVGAADSGSGTRHPGDGNDRNKRHRASNSSSDSSHPSVGELSSSSSSSSPSASSSGSTTSTNSTSSATLPSQESNRDSMLSNTRPQNFSAPVASTSNSDTLPSSSLTPSIPLSLSPPPRLPTPEIQEIEMPEYPLMEEALSISPASPVGASSTSITHPIISTTNTSTVTTSPPTRAEETLRLSLERFNAFDSAIEALRHSPSPSMLAQMRRTITPPPTLPPLELSSEEEGVNDGSARGDRENNTFDFLRSAERSRELERIRSERTDRTRTSSPGLGPGLHESPHRDFSLLRSAYRSNNNSTSTASSINSSGNDIAITNHDGGVNDDDDGDDGDDIDDMDVNSPLSLIRFTQRIRANANLGLGRSRFGHILDPSEDEDEGDDVAGGSGSLSVSETPPRIDLSPSSSFWTALDVSVDGNHTSAGGDDLDNAGEEDDAEHRGEEADNNSVSSFSPFRERLDSALEALRSPSSPLVPGLDPRSSSDSREDGNVATNRNQTNDGSINTNSTLDISLPPISTSTSSGIRLAPLTLEGISTANDPPILPPILTDEGEDHTGDDEEAYRGRGENLWQRPADNEIAMPMSASVPVPGTEGRDSQGTMRDWREARRRLGEVPVPSPSFRDFFTWMSGGVGNRTENGEELARRQLERNNLLQEDRTVDGSNAVLGEMLREVEAGLGISTRLDFPNFRGSGDEEEESGVLRRGSSLRTRFGEDRMRRILPGPLREAGARTSHFPLPTAGIRPLSLRRNMYSGSDPSLFASTLLSPANMLNSEVNASSHPTSSSRPSWSRAQTDSSRTGSTSGTIPPWRNWTSSSNTSLSSLLSSNPTSAGVRSHARNPNAYTNVDGFTSRTRYTGRLPTRVVGSSNSLVAENATEMRRRNAREELRRRLAQARGRAGNFPTGEDTRRESEDEEEFSENEVFESLRHWRARIRELDAETRERERDTESRQRATLPERTVAATSSLGQSQSRSDTSFGNLFDTLEGLTVPRGVDPGTRSNSREQWRYTHPRPRSHSLRYIPGVGSNTRSNTSRVLHGRNASGSDDDLDAPVGPLPPLPNFWGNYDDVSMLNTVSLSTTSSGLTEGEEQSRLNNSPPVRYAGFTENEDRSSNQPPTTYADFTDDEDIRMNIVTPTMFTGFAGDEEDNTRNVAPPTIYAEFTEDEEDDMPDHNVRRSNISASTPSEHMFLDPALPSPGLGELLEGLGSVESSVRPTVSRNGAEEHSQSAEDLRRLRERLDRETTRLLEGLETLEQNILNMPRAERRDASIPAVLAPNLEREVRGLERERERILERFNERRITSGAHNRSRGVSSGRNESDGYDREFEALRRQLTASISERLVNLEAALDQLTNSRNASEAVTTSGSDPATTQMIRQSRETPASSSRTVESRRFIDPSLFEPGPFRTTMESLTSRPTPSAIQSSSSSVATPSLPSNTSSLLTTFSLPPVSQRRNPTRTVSGIASSRATASNQSAAPPMIPPLSFEDNDLQIGRSDVQEPLPLTTEVDIGTSANLPPRGRYPRVGMGVLPGPAGPRQRNPSHQTQTQHQTNENSSSQDSHRVGRHSISHPPSLPQPHHENQNQIARSLSPGPGRNLRPTLSLPPYHAVFGGAMEVDVDRSPSFATTEHPGNPRYNDRSPGLFEQTREALEQSRRIVDESRRFMERVWDETGIRLPGFEIGLGDANGQGQSVSGSGSRGMSTEQGRAGRGLYRRLSSVWARSRPTTSTPQPLSHSENFDGVPNEVWAGRRNPMQRPGPSTSEAASASMARPPRVYGASRYSAGDHTAEGANDDEEMEAMWVSRHRTLGAMEREREREWQQDGSSQISREARRIRWLSQQQRIASFRMSANTGGVSTGVDGPNDNVGRAGRFSTWRLNWPRPRNFGDYMNDDDFDGSYESLLALQEALGDARPRSTPDHVIAKMRSATYREWAKEGSDVRCPICLEDYSPEDTVMKLGGCTHWLHKECLQKWLKSANTCPVCRKKVDPDANSGPRRCPWHSRQRTATDSSTPRQGGSQTTGPSGSGASNMRAGPSTAQAGSSHAGRTNNEDRVRPSGPRSWN